MGIAAVTGIYSGTFRVPRRKAFTVQQENQVKEEVETFFSTSRSFRSRENLDGWGRWNVSSSITPFRKL